MSVLSLLSLMWFLVTANASCEVVIEVDQSSKINCGIEDSVKNVTCSDLQDALLLVSRNVITKESDKCIAVSVHPGTYYVNTSISIDQNLVLNGSSNVTVDFLKNEVSNTYAVQFLNSNYVKMNKLSFSNSEGLIAFENVTSVVVKECSFSYFTNGALDMYNCPMVTVSDSYFEHNGPVSLLKLKAFHGYAAGLSIGFNNLLHNSPQVNIDSCVFRNNTNKPSPELVQSTSQVYHSFQFTGRGGGCSLVVNPLHSLTAVISQCLFESNYAESFGGGLYVLMNGQVNHHLAVNESVFLKNECTNTAGGLELAFLENTDDALNSVDISNSVFFLNKAVFGGGVFIFTPDSGGILSEQIRFWNCTFIENVAEEFGSAMAIVGLVLFRETISVRPIEIKDCTFSNNNGGRGGIVSTGYLPISFYGTNVFSGNRGRTLVDLGAHIDIHGNLTFLNNGGMAIDGGALFITSLGQIQLFNGAIMDFTGNTGVLGAAIVVETRDFVSHVPSKLIHNPLCFMLYEDETKEPDMWQNVSLSFSSNKALIGSAVYLTDLDLCSWVGLKQPYFDKRRVFHWRFVEFENNNVNSAHYPYHYDQEWYVQTPADVINVTTDNITAFPGQEFVLSLGVYDELGRPTAAVARISERDDKSHIRFDPEVVTLDLIHDISDVVSTFYQASRATTVREEELLVESILSYKSSVGNFHLTLEGCPPGYVHKNVDSSSHLVRCECDTDNPTIIECDGTTIHLMENSNWGTRGSYSDRSHGDSLVTYPCPPRYCKCIHKPYHVTSTICLYAYDSLSPDSQCQCDRKGVLCGMCRHGKGVTVLLNRCSSCNNASGLLILLLIIVDVIVILFLVTYVKFFPSWFYSCSFYIQTLPYIVEHFPWTFERISPYLLYVSSALSFYFAYDFCIYEGMSPLMSYFIRYTPFLTASVVIPVVVVVRYFFKKPRNPWNGIWWVLVMMYTHLVHTSVNLFNCPSLPDGTSKSGKEKLSWYVDGSVQCFTGGHAALSVGSFFMLLFIITVIPGVLIYSTGRLQKPMWLKSFAEALQEGFKAEYRWWATIELTRRLLTVVLVVSFPGNEYPVIFLLCIMTVVYGALKPFKNYYYNVLEILLCVNAIILLLLRNIQQSVAETLQTVPVQDVTTATNDTQCQSTTDRVTTFAMVLSVLYYFPILILLAVIGIHITAVSVRSYLKRFHAGVPVTNDEQHRQTSVTTTFINIEELNESTKSGVHSDRVRVGDDDAIDKRLLGRILSNITGKELSKVKIARQAIKRHQQMELCEHEIKADQVQDTECIKEAVIK